MIVDKLKTFTFCSYGLQLLIRAVLLAWVPPFLFATQGVWARNINRFYWTIEIIRTFFYFCACNSSVLYWNGQLRFVTFTYVMCLGILSYRTFLWQVAWQYRCALMSAAVIVGKHSCKILTLVRKPSCSKVPSRDSYDKDTASRRCEMSRGNAVDEPYSLAKNNSIKVC